jgi:hypothetical protein
VIGWYGASSGMPTSTVNGELLYGSAGSWALTGSTLKYASGYFQMNSSATTGRINFNTAGTTVADGLSWGDSANLYRSAANTLRTAGNFVVAGTATLSGLQFPGSDSTAGAFLGTNGAGVIGWYTANGMIPSSTNGELLYGDSGSWALTGSTLKYVSGYLQMNSSATAGRINFNTAGTTVADGLSWGDSANLYRKSANGLKIDGVLGIGVDPVATYQLITKTNYETPTSQLHTNIAGVFLGTKGVAAGVVDSGACIGSRHYAFRNHTGADSSGTLTELTGVSIQYGHYSTIANAAPVTAEASALRVITTCYKGTIGSSYILKVDNDQISGGTVTRRWLFYAPDALAKSYIGGFIGLGSSSSEHASITSRITLPAGTTEADGLLWGTDTNLYRSAANFLKSDDSLQLASTATAGRLNFNTAGTTVADGLSWGDSANLYRSAANTVKTDGNLNVTGTATLAGLQFPASDSSAGAFLGTNGAGVIGWYQSSGMLPSSTNGELLYGSSGSWALTGSTLKYASGYLQMNSSATAGRINFNTAGTTVADGLSWGDSANLYRSAANTLRTAGNFVVAGTATLSGLQFPGSDSSAGAFLGTNGAGVIGWYTSSGMIPSSTDGELLYGASGSWSLTGSTLKYASGYLQMNSTATTGRINFNTAGSTVADGLSWGDSANVYRSTANTVKIDGKLSLGKTSTSGTEYGGSQLLITRQSLTVENGNNSNYGLEISLNPCVNQGVTDSGKAIGIYGIVQRNYVASDSSGTLSSLIGIDLHAGHNTSTASSPVTTTMMGASIRSYFMTGSIGTHYGLFIGSTGSNYPTTNWGIYEYGAGCNYFASKSGFGVSTYANITSRITLPAGTTAADGLLWGTDTNLYRSAVNTLRTDDNLAIGGTTITADSSITISTVAGNVILGQANHKWPNGDGSPNQVLSTNGSGVLSWVTAGTGGGTSLVVQDSGSYTIISSDIGKMFKNSGSGTCIYNLPSATTSLNYMFYCDNGELRVFPTSGQRIRLFNGLTADSGGYISTIDVGSSVQLVAIDSSTWAATYITGIWQV